MRLLAFFPRRSPMICVIVIVILGQIPLSGKLIAKHQFIQSFPYPNKPSLAIKERNYNKKESVEDTLNVE
jgi:hypothetical protein